MVANSRSNRVYWEIKMNILKKLLYTLFIPLLSFLRYIINGVIIDNTDDTYWECLKDMFTDIWEI